MLSRLRSWALGVFRRDRLETDLAEEMQAHLEMRAEHWRAQGLSVEEAARRARLEFGGLDRYKDECRQARGLRLLDELNDPRTLLGSALLLLTTALLAAWLPSRRASRVEPMSALRCE
jgi:hypothetical protein